MHFKHRQLRASCGLDRPIASLIRCSFVGDFIFNADCIECLLNQPIEVRCQNRCKSSVTREVSKSIVPGVTDIHVKRLKCTEVV